MRKSVLAAATAAVLAASPAFAADDSGFYVGAGLGNFALDSDTIYNGKDFDGSDIGYKVFGGYQFMRYLAVELEYLDGGEPDDNFRDDRFPDERLKVSAGVTGFVGSAVGILPIGERFDVFGKLGFIYWDGDGSGKIRDADGTLAKISYGNDGTDFAWAVGGTWHITHNLGLRAEYQGFEIDDFNSVDFASGSIVYKFGRSAPAAAAPVAAAPVAAASAKPMDSDGDGVVDSEDRCPNTPQGDRVGPNGCSCDVTIRTHFAFDSAELTAQDKTELERVAARLKELEFVGGTATGHTDNVGDEAYNQKLSERRAQAVVDFLQAQGVAAGRITAIGMGEVKPLADNATEEGRAQNRRVTIRRTDCGPAE
jgi:outer membrane protein OmpA-like peptidoglycan-associated protein